MKAFNKMRTLVLLQLAVLFIIFAQFFFIAPRAFAATSPTLGTDLSSFSVLAGDEVTCTGSTTLSGGVGVSPGTSISGFPSPCTAGGGVHSNDASAIAAQADNLSAFGTLDQTCDQTFGAVDLTTTFPAGVGPGVYCSTSSFTLSGNLNLTGSGVWIFKTVSTLITSPGSSVTGGDACNVWWRIGSSATLDTTTSFQGNILSLLDITMNTGATLNGRALAQSAGIVTLDANTISGPNCTSPTPTPTPTAPPAPGGDGLSDGRSDGRSDGMSDGLSSAPVTTTVAPSIGNYTLIPRLPNTGVDTHENNILWPVSTGVLIGILLVLTILIKRRRKFSHEH